MGKPYELITGCSRVSQLSDDHYCGTVLHSVIDSQGFPTTGDFLGGEFCLSFFDKSSNDIKFCNVCNVAEVWRCSEHYLWLFDGGLYLDPFTAMYCCCVVVSEDAKTTLVRKLYLSRGGSYSV